MVTTTLQIQIRQLFGILAGVLAETHALELHGNFHHVDCLHVVHEVFHVTLDCIGDHLSIFSLPRDVRESDKLFL